MNIYAWSRVRTCASLRRVELKSTALDHSAIQAKNIRIKPHAGLEPATLRLKVLCSTDWAKGALLHKERIQKSFFYNHQPDADTFVCKAGIEPAESS